MKTWKKISLLILVFLLFIATFLYTHKDSQEITHFEHALATFEKHKKDLVNYYSSHQYMTDVCTICKDAQTYFDKVLVKENSLIVFDVDDTALIHFQTRDQLNFIWTQLPHLLKAQREDWDPALQPVLELYQNVLKKGFKVIFITGRRSDIKEKTLANLAAAGFTGYQDLLFFPDELLNKVSIGEWKAEQRKKLALTYDIVGNVGDRPLDFEGGNNGHIVKLPNYLY